MNSRYISILAAIAPLAAACGGGGSTTPADASTPDVSAPDGSAQTTDLIFSAVEDDGVVAALDAKTGKLIKTIDLSEASMGSTVHFDVHNVQGSADARMVWATAMPVMDGDGGTMTMPDELVGIDATSMSIVRRIPLGAKQHPAHVVLDGTTAFVTAYEANAVLQVDLAAGKLAKTIALPAGTSPHGERLTPDHKTLVVAGMGSGAIVLIDTATGAVQSFALPAPAIQTAVLPDGSAALATIYSTKQVARLDLTSKKIQLFSLPAGAVGPAQLYPTPDGMYVWIADQGVTNNQPAGSHLYRMDAMSGAVNLTANVGAAPHGVVLNDDGSIVWSTMQSDGTVQSIDANTGAVLTTVPIGKTPNGVTCVHGTGSMP